MCQLKFRTVNKSPVCTTRYTRPKENGQNPITGCERRSITITLEELLEVDNELPRIMLEYERTSEALAEEDLTAGEFAEMIREAAGENLYNPGTGSLTRAGGIAGLEKTGEGGEITLRAELRDRREHHYSPRELVIDYSSGEILEGEDLIEELEEASVESSFLPGEIRLDAEVGDGARKICGLFDEDLDEMLENGAVRVEGEIRDAELAWAKRTVKKTHAPTRWKKMSNSIGSYYGKEPAEIAEEVRGRRLELDPGSIGTGSPVRYVLGDEECRGCGRKMNDLPDYLNTGFRLRSVNGFENPEMRMEGEKTGGKQVGLDVELEDTDRYVCVDLDLSFAGSLANSFEFDVLKMAGDTGFREHAGEPDYMPVERT
ncbi:MAG: hypothetical protein ABEK01_05515 [Candidatus Nanohaloarchaea archaeon]